MKGVLNGRNTDTDSVLQLIHSATQGIPRLTNHICTYALYDAQQNGSDVIEDKDIGRILTDMERQRGTAQVTTGSKKNVPLLPLK